MTHRVALGVLRFQNGELKLALLLKDTLLDLLQLTENFLLAGAVTVKAFFRDAGVFCGTTLVFLQITFVSMRGVERHHHLLHLLHLLDVEHFALGCHWSLLEVLTALKALLERRCEGVAPRVELVFLIIRHLKKNSSIINKNDNPFNR